jgi:hypothetical protein
VLPLSLATRNIPQEILKRFSTHENHERTSNIHMAVYYYLWKLVEIYRPSREFRKLFEKLKHECQETFEEQRPL